MNTITAQLAAAPAAVRAAVIASMGADDLRATLGCFAERAHGGQVAPLVTPNGADWRTWVIMGGRGFGKTRAGAEWVLGVCRAHAKRPHPPTASRRAPPSPVKGEGLRVALVGASIADARAVMVEGTAGILACARPGEVTRYVRSANRIEFRGGAVAALYSGASPQGLRGPEHDFAWCDELAKWRHPSASWDMLQLGLRRGVRPRALVTTTPAACEVLERILAAGDTVRTGGGTRANRHLPAAFIDAMEAQYRGTRLAGPELDGEMPREVLGAFWTRESVAGWRCAAVEAPSARSARGDDPARPSAERDLSRVVVGVDPPATVAGTCGIMVCGLRADGVAVVLDDRSVASASPERWARSVAEAARDWGADRVVAEANQGGDMVASVLRAANAALPLEMVRASRGKAARAEPVAALFENGRARFAGVFPELETELRGFVPGGYAGSGSPDRADAMVWALWALAIRVQPVPGVRRV